MQVKTMKTKVIKIRMDEFIFSVSSTNAAALKQADCFCKARLHCTFGSPKKKKQPADWRSVFSVCMWSWHKPGLEAVIPCAADKHYLWRHGGHRQWHSIIFFRILTHSSSALHRGPLHSQQLCRWFEMGSESFLQSLPPTPFRALRQAWIKAAPPLHVYIHKVPLLLL